MGIWTSLSRVVIKERKVILKDKMNKVVCLSIEGPWDMLDVNR